MACFGHLEKFWDWAKNRKTQFPGARGPKIEKKRYHTIRDGCPQLFYILRFDRLDPQGREITKYWVSRRFWPRAALGTWRNLGAKTEKCNFPELGAHLGGKSIRPKSFSQKVRNLFTICVLANRTRRAGKSQNTGVLDTFGPGRPLALREIPGRTKKSTNSLVETEKR